MKVETSGTGSMINCRFEVGCRLPDGSGEIVEHFSALRSAMRYVESFATRNKLKTDVYDICTKRLRKYDPVCNKWTWEWSFWLPSLTQQTLHENQISN